MNRAACWQAVLLFLGLACLAGCQKEPSYTYVSPDGTRYEYTRSELEVMDNGETHYRRPPREVNVWRTRPGPETGPNSHELINPWFTGYESTDIPVIEREAGMQAGVNQWPHNQSSPPLASEVSVYWQKQQVGSTRMTPARSSKKTASHSNCTSCGRTSRCKSTKNTNPDGFSNSGPAWMQENYGSDSGLADWLRQQLANR